MAAQNPVQLDLFDATDFLYVDIMLSDEHKNALIPIVNGATTMVRYAALHNDTIWTKIDCTAGMSGSTTWNLHGHVINVNVKRLGTLRANNKCVCCGIEGNTFLIERHQNDKDTSRHLNMYAVDKGHIVLMTVDHILPDSMAGRYSPLNFQTMCSKCNSAKQNVMSLAEIATVRANMHKHVKSWAYRPYIELLLELQEMMAGLKNNPKRKQMYNALTKATKHLIQNKSSEKHMLVHYKHLQNTINQLKDLPKQPAVIIRPVEPRVTTYYEDFYRWAVAKLKELRKYRLVVQKIA